MCDVQEGGRRDMPRNVDRMGALMRTDAWPREMPHFCDGSMQGVRCTLRSPLTIPLVWVLFALHGCGSGMTDMLHGSNDRPALSDGGLPIDAPQVDAPNADSSSRDGYASAEADLSSDDLVAPVSRDANVSPDGAYSVGDAHGLDASPSPFCKAPTAPPSVCQVDSCIGESCRPSYACHQDGTLVCIGGSICSWTVGPGCATDCSDEAMCTITTVGAGASVGCEDAKKCDVSCGDACNVLCGSTGPCRVTAKQGSSLECVLGATCQFVCPEGGCKARCDGKAACTLEARAGDSTVSCADRSHCSVVCPAGTCTVTCDASSKCTCSGPGCTLK